MEHVSFFSIRTLVFNALYNPKNTKTLIIVFLEMENLTQDYPLTAAVMDLKIGSTVYN
jgi:hypothetical protein